jgi:cytochrome oxidase assembly protein ShyY1
VNSKQERRERPFEELKEAIRPVVETRKAEQRGSELAQQAAVALVNNKDLDAVAKTLNAQVKETPLIEPGGAIPDLGNAAELDKKMFTMNKGEIGTAIQVDRGFVVPQVTDIVAAHPASLEEAKDKVVADAKIEKAKQLATDKAKQAEELMKGGKDLNAAAKAVGGDVKTSEFVTRSASIPEFGRSWNSIKNFSLFRLEAGHSDNCGRQDARLFSERTAGNQSGGNEEVYRYASERNNTPASRSVLPGIRSGSEEEDGIEQEDQDQRIHREPDRSADFVRHKDTMKARR